MRKVLPCWIVLASILLLFSCTTTKFVPQNEYLLDEVKIRTDNKNVRPYSLRPYLRQTPNSKWFSLIKTQLYIYNLAGRDSTKWGNKLLKRIGDAPVIYSPVEAERSREEILNSVRNMGYMTASVEQIVTTKKKKLKLLYNVKLGSPYVVEQLGNELEDTTLAPYLKNDSTESLLSEGMLFDVNVLDQERRRITEKLQQNGYYKFNKEYIGYIADTVLNTHKVGLTKVIRAYKDYQTDSLMSHRQYKIGNISFIADYDMLNATQRDQVLATDSILYGQYPIYFKDKLDLRPKLLTDNLFFHPEELYNERMVQRTYSGFGRLSALKYTNIRFVETIKDNTNYLDCYVLLTKNKQKSVAFEVEGTNSAGDLGAAASISFQNRNMFHGSETFMVKLRGAYEVISGLQSGYADNNYMEYGVETSINFPKFLFPFLSSSFRQKIRATTEFGLQYNYQLRPEFIRTMATASWSYKWSKDLKRQHVFDLLSVTFLYLPSISDKFREDYIEKGQNYIFQYNYEDRLIINMGYNYTYNSVGGSIVNNTVAANSYSIHLNLESAGNVMYLISKAANIRKNSNDEYSILGIPFAQYIKGELDYAKNFRIDLRNALAFHLYFGLAVPYGNAISVPFEKQFFSGGANSVRGWSVRELGPGSFEGDGNLLDQSGDIKLNANIEYRSKLFWKLEGAVFVDAGNIWAIRDYENQPGGVFKFNKFYKQIAVAYGLGLRFDLDFFILRFDGGMKAINPVYESGKNRYPVIHPDFGRDFAFHFAVGYPF